MYDYPGAHSTPFQFPIPNDNENDCHSSVRPNSMKTHWLNEPSSQREAGWQDDEAPLKRPTEMAIMTI